MVIQLPGVIEERHVVALAQAQHALQVTELGAADRGAAVGDVARGHEEARHVSPRA